MHKTNCMQSIEQMPLWEVNLVKYEARHQISNNVVSATSKGSDQPAHRRSLTRAFDSRLNILLLLSN